MRILGPVVTAVWAAGFGYTWFYLSHLALPGLRPARSVQRVTGSFIAATAWPVTWTLIVAITLEETRGEPART